MRHSRIGVFLLTVRLIDETPDVDGSVKQLRGHNIGVVIVDDDDAIQAPRHHSVRLYASATDLPKSLKELIEEAVQ